VQQATYISAVVVGTYMVFAGDFTVGTIIAIGILTGRTLGPLAQLVGHDGALEPRSRPR
jgi:ATP-binding cassette subfamily C protein LapB